MVLMNSKRETALLVFSILFGGTGTANGQAQKPTKCATDPTYKFFEEEQRKAYEANPAVREMWQKTAAMREALEGVDKLLRDRPNSMNLDPSISEKESKEINEAVLRMKLPTCYENPLIYYMIDQYVKKVEKARRQLKLPLKSPPRYGSLPTSDINAYTYPAVTDKDVIDKRDSVIGFNVQLFMFAYQMTKVTLPTIDVRGDPNSGKVRIDFSHDTAIRAIESNPDLKINFTMALLEFLQIVAASTEPLDRKFDADLMAFTISIELFAVAHEYGHLIKGHTFQGTRSLKLNPGNAEVTKPLESLVAVRSWQQELEADSIGIQLLNQILKNNISDSSDEILRKAAQLRQVYALYGALFFFKCSDLIEKARYLKEHGSPPPPLTSEEKDYERGLADGRATAEQQSKFSKLAVAGHPPAWLRLERAKIIIDKYLTREGLSDDAREYSQVALGLIQNIDALWDMSVPRLPTIIKAVQQNQIPAEIGYVQSPAMWMNTFLLNPALQGAIMKFRDQVTPDADVIQQYQAALKTDWLLLSGLQVWWAEEVVTSNDRTKLGEALAVLALSGDMQSVDVLKKLDVSDWSETDRTLLARTIKFLDRNGRDTSVNALVKISPAEFKLTDLLCFPAKLNKIAPIEALIPNEIPRDVTDFLRRNRAVVEGRSLSSMALYMLVAKTDQSVTNGFWSDLLLRAGNPDAALSYAQLGVSKAGATASLENDIGNILSAKGDLRGAIPHYEASLRLGRVDGWPEVNMAKNYADLGDLKQAEDLFRRALTRRATARSETEYAGYLNELAWFLATKFKEDAARAKESLSLSIQSNQIVRYSNPNYLDTLAECQAANGDIQSAIKSSRAALSLLPSDSKDRAHYAKRLAEFESRQNK